MTPKPLKVKSTKADMFQICDELFGAGVNPSMQKLCARTEDVGGGAIQAALEEWRSLDPDARNPRTKPKGKATTQRLTDSSEEIGNLRLEVATLAAKVGSHDTAATDLIKQLALARREIASLRATMDEIAPKAEPPSSPTDDIADLRSKLAAIRQKYQPA